MKKILLVEDEMLIQEYYHDLLNTNKNYKVTIVSNGQEAFEITQKEEFDLILLDIMMPIMDGITFLSKFKKEPPKKKQGPIILLTNLNQNDVSELQDLYKQYNNKPENLGVIDYIVKAAIKPAELLEKVKTGFLSKKTAR